MITLVSVIPYKRDSMFLKRLLGICFFITISIFGSQASAQDAELKNVQSFLADNGYVVGTADGIMGPRTSAAIETFQRDQNIPVTGLVDEATLSAIQLVRNPMVVEPITPPPPPSTKSDNSTVYVWALVGGAIVFLLMQLFRKKPVESSASPKGNHVKSSYQDVSKTPREPYGEENSGLNYLPSESYWKNKKATKSMIAKAQNKPADLWVKKGDSAVVAGRKIDGLVYVGAAPRTGRYGQTCRAHIDPSLSVAKNARDPNGDQMSYWPSYSGISPSSRATYLDWLASGREDAEYNVGYMFLYFYGLERRFFVDEPEDAEKVVLLTEVKRLRDIFVENYSAKNYLGRFIDVAETTMSINQDRAPVFEHSGYELPLSVLIEVGTRISRGESLQADWALSWFMCHPERHLRTPANRCVNEFIALFRIKFSRNYPEGLRIKKPQRLLRAKYRAASSEFDLEITPTSDGKKIPDVSGLRKPISDMQKIADDVMAELDKYSRYLGRKPDGRGSIEAQALLPVSLWSHFPCKELNELKLWTEGIIKSGGLVPVTTLLAKLEGEKSEKIGKRQLIGAADALGKLGFGMAPDPRYAMRSPKAEDPVILFTFPKNETALEEVTDAYRSALMKLALGAFIAQADGTVSSEEKSALSRLLDADSDINLSEKLRLSANLDWYLRVPPNMSLLRKNLKNASEIQRHAFREIVVSMAHADGVIHPEEISRIEKIYKALGIESTEIYSDIHSATITEIPGIVRTETLGAEGEPIPQDMSGDKLQRSSNHVLDASRIAAIQADTNRVSSVLGEIFSDGEHTESDVESGDESESPLSGLDPKHASFVDELIQRAKWSEDEFAMLANRYDLMASGSLETINEWAFEKFDDALIEDYDGYEMNSDIVSKLKTELREVNFDHNKTP